MSEPRVITCKTCDGTGVTAFREGNGVDSMPSYLVVCEHQIVPQDCPYCELKRLRAELESERVAHNHFAVVMEHRALQAEAQRNELLSALKMYVEWFGSAHTAECPMDDTCDCEAKCINDAVNRAIAKAEGN